MRGRHAKNIRFLILLVNKIRILYSLFKDRNLNNVQAVNFGLKKTKVVTT